MGRWFRFIIAILAGIGVGIVYGWVINPIEYIETTPDTLRVDYKTDYVLMVAESYQADKDLNLAVRRLALLGGPSPSEAIQNAISFAERAGYSDTDLDRMRALARALQNYQPGLETQTP